MTQKQNNEEEKAKPESSRPADTPAVKPEEKKRKKICYPLYPSTPHTSDR